MSVVGGEADSAQTVFIRRSTVADGSARLPGGEIQDIIPKSLFPMLAEKFKNRVY
jgi:hypothetical protein